MSAAEQHLYSNTGPPHSEQQAHRSTSDHRGTTAKAAGTVLGPTGDTEPPPGPPPPAQQANGNMPVLGLTTEACKRSACAVQTCLSESNFDERACTQAIDQLKRCCSKIGRYSLHCSFPGMREEEQTTEQQQQQQQQAPPLEPPPPQPDELKPFGSS